MRIRFKKRKKDKAENVETRPNPELAVAPFRSVSDIPISPKVSKLLRYSDLLGIWHEPPGLLDVFDFTLMNDTHEAFAIWGRKGGGKSTLGLWGLHDTLVLRDPRQAYENEKKIWKTALSLTVLKPSEFDAIIESYEEKFGVKMYYDHRLRCPGIYWDDAGLHASRYFWYKRSLRRLSDFFDVIRTYVKVFLYSSPLITRVMKGMREGVLTGEIWVPHSRTMIMSSTLFGMRRKAVFILYSNVPDFYRPFEEYVLKRWLNAWGRELTFPKLPDWVRMAYEKKKYEATVDVQTERKKLEIRKREFVKKIEEELFPFEKAILQTVYHYFGRKPFGISALADVLRGHYKSKFGRYELESALRNLRSLDLVIIRDPVNWQLTEVGHTLCQVWEAEAEKVESE